MGDKPATVDFGFTPVPRAEKAARVRGVFDSVARRYDTMNDLMSLGVHRLWKRAFIAALEPRPGHHLLDLAGGTGDIAFGWRRAGGGPAWLTDVNASMLAVARDRATEAGLLDGLSFAVVDAERIPLPDRSVERVSIAFGLRNVTDRPAALAEARRVLRPGGRFLCLEFSRLTIGALAPAYDAWSFRVIPRIGRAVARDEDSYRYLAESIRMMPDQATLADVMRQAGFARVAVRNLSGGVVAIHSGWRL